MSTTITRKNWRGTYVARCELNDRGTIDREWAEISKVVKAKGGSIRYYSDLPAGWYETREGYKSYKAAATVKDYYRVTDLAVESITFEHFASALGGPVPGANGEYGTDYCACGAVVDTFDADGFPRCENHTVPVESDSLPVPV